MTRFKEALDLANQMAANKAKSLASAKKASLNAVNPTMSPAQIEAVRKKVDPKRHEEEAARRRSGPKKKKKNYRGARSPEQHMQDIAHSSDNSPRQHGSDELTADQIKAGETRKRRLAAVAAARESLIEALKERCWKGYEPTPGKKAYSKGSCKPKGKKKKK